MSHAVAGRRPRVTSLLDAAPPAPDVALALVLAVFAQLDLWLDLDNSTHFGPDAVTTVVVAVATLALAWRRRAPVATLVVVAAAVTVPELFTVLTVTLWGHFVPLVVALYSVARWSASRTAVVAGAALALAVVTGLMLRVPSLGSVDNIPFTLVPLACAVVAGRVLRTRQERHREVTDYARTLEVTRAEQIEAAVAAERARMARELHDIVTHSVSVMVVQAGAAEELLDRSPDAARLPLHAVQDTGRQAVAELGRMLGLLSTNRDPDEADPLAPTPGLAQLGELARRMTELGLPVELEVPDGCGDVPPGAQLAAYRVVQEALTNTLKHAGPGASARVDVRHQPGRSLDVEVVDAGGTDLVLDGAGHGFGLIGMRQRAMVYQGTVEAGRRPGGGYRVHLHLPLQPS